MLAHGQKNDVRRLHSPADRFHIGFLLWVEAGTLRKGNRSRRHFGQNTFPQGNRFFLPSHAGPAAQKVPRLPIGTDNRHALIRRKGQQAISVFQQYQRPGRRLPS